MTKVIEGQGTNPLNVSLTPDRVPAPNLATDTGTAPDQILNSRIGFTSRTQLAILASKLVSMILLESYRGQRKALTLIERLREMDPAILRPMLHQMQEAYDNTGLVHLQAALMKLMSAVVGTDEKPGLLKKAAHALKKGLSPLQEAGLRVLKDHADIKHVQQIFDYLRLSGIKPRLRALAEQVAQCVLQEGATAGA